MKTREIEKHIATLERISSQYLPGGPDDVKGAIRAAVAALREKISSQWFEWQGGKRPVAKDIFIEFEQRDGKVYRASAEECAWFHDGPDVQDGDSDIMRYRIIRGENVGGSDSPS